MSCLDGDIETSKARRYRDKDKQEPVNLIEVKDAITACIEHYDAFLSVC